jgi:ABC-type sugar transport system ATPase subunit
MVFQSYALYPHMSVYENLALNLRVRRVPRQEIDARVHETAAMLGIGDVLGHRPNQLSGGQRQRVALGRALIRRPNIFLMDEPLSNLDLKLRERTRTELKKLHERLRITTIYVTHDQAEALVLSDRIGVMHNGALLQVGTPREVYDRPADIFVATFIGSPSINLLRVRLHGGGEHSYLKLAGSGGDVAGFALTVPPAVARAFASLDGEAVLGVRPEALVLHRGTVPQALTAWVEFVEPMGAVNHVVLRPQEPGVVSADQDLLIAVVGAHEDFPQGALVWVTARPERLAVFHAKTGRAHVFM